jgi:hypothetical protein
MIRSSYPVEVLLRPVEIGTSPSLPSVVPSAVPTVPAHLEVFEGGLRRRRDASLVHHEEAAHVHDCRDVLIITGPPQCKRRRCGRPKRSF